MVLVVGCFVFVCFSCFVVAMFDLLRDVGTIHDLWKLLTCTSS